MATLGVAFGAVPPCPSPTLPAPERLQGMQQRPSGAVLQRAEVRPHRFASAREKGRGERGIYEAKGRGQIIPIKKAGPRHTSEGRKPVERSSGRGKWF